MPNYVPSLLLDQHRCLQHIALCRVLRFDYRQFLVRIVTKQILEDRVETWGVLHNPICRSTFVEDRHRRSIQFRILKYVFVDELTENFPGLGFLLAQNGCAGETDDSRIW